MSKANILWGLFLAVALLGLFYIFQASTGVVHGSILSLNGVNLTGKLILASASALLILHSVWVLGALPALSVLLLGFSIGFFSEVLGVRYGVIFGGTYMYNPSIHPSLFGVPLVIPLVWAGFIYCGYSLVSSCLLWASENNPPESVKRLPLAATAGLGALAVLAIDIVMEPLQVAAGSWTWFETGPYFHIPTGNFIGWFLVSFVCISVFQSSRLLYPQKETRVSPEVRLIPVFGYGLLGLVLSGWALRSGSIWLALIGAACMSPGVFINLYLFSQWRKRQMIFTAAQLSSSEVL